MLIAIDVGNTQTTVGYFSTSGLEKQWRLSTHPLCTSDEFKLKLEMILKGLPFQSIVVSSVVPPFTRMLKAAYPEAHIIDSEWPFSFEIRAQQVGMDRLVNAETVAREYGDTCIIVDSGTATTLCALSQGAYLGGAILPGIHLSMEALAAKTALLFTIELVPPSAAIGNNTKGALKSGLLLGYASMIDGMVQRFKQELGRNDLPVIATGGISQLMKGLCKELTHFEPDLTLRGIAYLYESIRKR